MNGPTLFDLVAHPSVPPSCRIVRETLHDTNAKCLTCGASLSYNVEQEGASFSVGAISLAQLCPTCAAHYEVEGK